MIAVSACLIGENVKYNGGNNQNNAVLSYLEGKEYIIICPEVFGGLPIPRYPSEIIKDKVINTNGDDVTKNFVVGAHKALKMIEENNVNIVILKAKSPSCGYQEIYDGTFSHHTTNGNGIFVEMLLNKNIKIYTEKEIEELKNEKNI